MRTLILGVVAALGFAAAAQAQMPAPADIVKQWDTDGNGSISEAEWTAAGRPAARFAMVDADKDGQITVAELTAAFAAMRQRGG